MSKDWHDFPDFDVDYYGRRGVEIPNVWADWGWRDWLPIVGWVVPAVVFAGGVWLVQWLRGDRA